MRCLGRLLVLAFIAVVALAAWLFRNDLRRVVNERLHPRSAAVETGHPTSAALTNATTKLQRMGAAERDSTTLSASELASLLVDGVHILPGLSRDSLTVELGDGDVRVRTVVDTATIPDPWRKLLTLRGGRYASVVVHGAMTPVRAGLGEFTVDRLSANGVPVPVDMAARVIAGVTGRAGGERIDIPLPASVGGFRVRHDGVTVYRAGGNQ
ncbi:MAG TPA: hypothetical protein VGM20_14280 [Gemmatimonadales bacterium]|jgi:hypothetical protein